MDSSQRGDLPGSFLRYAGLGCLGQQKSWFPNPMKPRTPDGWTTIISFVRWYWRWSNFTKTSVSYTYFISYSVHKSNRDDYAWCIYYLILNYLIYIILWLCKTCPDLESRNFLFDECLAFCEVEIVGPISIRWTVMRPAYSRSATRILHARRSFTHWCGQKVFWNPRSCQYVIQKQRIYYFQISSKKNIPPSSKISIVELFLCTTKTSQNTFFLATRNPAPTNHLGY